MTSYHLIQCNNCGAANQNNASFCSTCGHALQKNASTNPLPGDDDALSQTLISHSVSLLKDRYRIIDQLGTGGMDSVYQADRHLCLQHCRMKV